VDNNNRGVDNNREDATATIGWRTFIPAPGALDSRHLRRYLTNALDPEHLPVLYAVALYWQRWRIEIV